MTTQPQMFPPTVDELLAAFRARLVADLENAVGRAVKANTKVDEARDDLAVFDAAMAARHVTPPITTDDLLPVNELEAAADQEAAPSTVTVSGPAVEPFAVEVGERTRAAALVFAYCEQVGIADPDPDEWRIFDEAGCNVLGSEVVRAGAYRVERRQA